MESIGERIMKYRKKKGLSQIELARRLGVSDTFISKLERGKKDPNLKMLEKISDVLEVDFFYSDEESNLMNDLELSDEELIAKYNLKVDGKEVSDKEIKWMLKQIRDLRELTD